MQRGTRRQSRRPDTFPRSSSPCPWTATAPTFISIPTKAARSPWPKRAATSPAPARCRWARPTISTCANPHKPELFWQLKETVRGLAEACRAFNAPVTGGNCSLYNQNPAGPIDPTPTVADGRPDREAGAHHHAMVQGRRRRHHPARRRRWMPATRCCGLGGRAYLQAIHGKKTGTPPRCDLEKEKSCTSPCAR